MTHTQCLQVDSVRQVKLISVI